MNNVNFNFYDFKLTSTLSSNSSVKQFNVTLTVNAGNISMINVNYMLVHTNNSLTEYLYFYDTGSITAISNVQTSTPSLVSFAASNFMVGLTSFTSNPFVSFAFSLQTTPSFTLTSSTGYTQVEFTYFNFRIRSCGA